MGKRKNVADPGQADVSPERPSLVRRGGSLCLEWGGMSVCADFSRLLQRTRNGRLGGEAAVKAAGGIKKEPRTAVDMTAGLGEDAFLLAAAGFTVYMIEADRDIASLLRDGLERASADPELRETVSRMSLTEGDSTLIETVPGLQSPPDVVYLDPMFPQRRKSGFVKKKLRLMALLEPPCTDEGAVRLLQAALALRPGRIVIKRPSGGPPLGGARPDFSIPGDVIRYDVLVPGDGKFTGFS